MIEWTISHERQLVSARVIERATPEHFESYLSAVNQAGAAGYRKLFSMTRQARVEAQDIPAFAALVRSHARGVAKVGPVAIVVGTDESNALADWFRSLATVDRPVRIFQGEGTAIAWLDGLAPPSALA